MADSKRETLTAYYLADPAFAACDAKDIVRWARTRDPEEMPGPLTSEPVQYRFQRLRRSQIYSYVETAPTEKERYERAFAAAVVEIKGGHYGQSWRPAELGKQGYVAADPDELDEAGVSLAEAWDVGQWIYAASTLGKGSKPRLPPLPSSLLAWDALEHPSAEQSQG